MDLQVPIRYTVHVGARISQRSQVKRTATTVLGTVRESTELNFFD